MFFRFFLVSSSAMRFFIRSHYSLDADNAMLFRVSSGSKRLHFALRFPISFSHTFWRIVSKALMPAAERWLLAKRRFCLCLVDLKTPPLEFLPPIRRNLLHRFVCGITSRAWLVSVFTLQDALLNECALVPAQPARIYSPPIGHIESKLQTHGGTHKLYHKHSKVRCIYAIVPAS